MMTSPRHTRFALALALLLPVYFVAAALGTKFGLWDWRVGLGTLTIRLSPVLIGLVALVALSSLVAAVWRKPRNGWLLSSGALIVPVVIFAGFLALRTQAQGIPPIHDISTDRNDPPAFSLATMTQRDAQEANELSEYRTPLKSLYPWRAADPKWKDLSHAQIIAAYYPGMRSLPIGPASEELAAKAIAYAMEEMGFSDIVVRSELGVVEGVAQTFWFGFKDDVVARIRTDRIDFRSVSRVGLSDLGANAARIGELRARVAKSLGN